MSQSGVYTNGGPENVTFGDTLIKVGETKLVSWTGYAAVNITSGAGGITQKDLQPDPIGNANSTGNDPAAA